MKNEKNDRRSKYSQNAIKAATLGLLGQKPLNRITVAEVCKNAEVNRGTFYHHFYDIYDVFESIEQEFYDEVKNMLEAGSAPVFSDAFFKEIMQLIEDNLNLVSIILSGRDNGNFLTQAIAFVKRRFTEEIRALYPHCSDEDIERVFLYSLNGSIGVITDWIKRGGQKSGDGIALIIGKYNNIIFDSLR